MRWTDAKSRERTNGKDDSRIARGSHFPSKLIRLQLPACNDILFRLYSVFCNYSGWMYQPSREPLSATNWLHHIITLTHICTYFADEKANTACILFIYSNLQQREGEESRSKDFIGMLLKIAFGPDPFPTLQSICWIVIWGWRLKDFKTFWFDPISCDLRRNSVYYLDLILLEQQELYCNCYSRKNNCSLLITYIKFRSNVSMIVGNGTCLTWKSFNNFHNNWILIHLMTCDIISNWSNYGSILQENR